MTREELIKQTQEQAETIEGQAQKIADLEGKLAKAETAALLAKVAARPFTPKPAAAAAKPAPVKVKTRREEYEAMRPGAERLAFLNKHRAEILG